MSFRPDALDMCLDGRKDDWRIVAENPTDPEVRKLVSIVRCRRPHVHDEKRETVSAGPGTVPACDDNTRTVEG
jgi:hypothetical protein